MCFCPMMKAKQKRINVQVFLVVLMQPNQYCLCKNCIW